MERKFIFYFVTDHYCTALILPYYNVLILKTHIPEIEIVSDKQAGGNVFKCGYYKVEKKRKGKKL